MPLPQLGIYKKIEDYVDTIKTYLEDEAKAIKTENDMGYYNRAKIAEDFFANILNRILNLNLRNLNFPSADRIFEEKRLKCIKKGKDFPGVDIGDFENRIAFQITSCKEKHMEDKIEHTWKVFRHNEHLREAFDDIYILNVLKLDNCEECNNGYLDELKIDKSHFQVWDLKTLENEIQHLTVDGNKGCNKNNTDRYKDLCDFLDKWFGTNKRFQTVEQYTETILKHAFEFMQVNKWYTVHFPNLCKNGKDSGKYASAVYLEENFIESLGKAYCVLKNSIPEWYDPNLTEAIRSLKSILYDLICIIKKYCVFPTNIDNLFFSITPPPDVSYSGDFWLKIDCDNPEAPSFDIRDYSHCKWFYTNYLIKTLFFELKTITDQIYQIKKYDFYPGSLLKEYRFSSIQTTLEKPLLPHFLFPYPGIKTYEDKVLFLVSPYSSFFTSVTRNNGICPTTLTWFPEWLKKFDKDDLFNILRHSVQPVRAIEEIIKRNINHLCQKKNCKIMYVDLSPCFDKSMDDPYFFKISSFRNLYVCIIEKPSQQQVAKLWQDWAGAGISPVCKGCQYVANCPHLPAFRLKWYHDAAERGSAKAQYFIGRCYWDGSALIDLRLPFEKDRAKALDFLQKAAAQGYNEAIKFLEKLRSWGY